jgi:hypothetical protein
MNRVVIYTAIFGSYDGLIPQKKIPGVDFICFTDQNFKSSSWKVIKCKRKFSDDNRNAKEYKVLPHRFLQDYHTSIWIDGNLMVIHSPMELLESLDQSPLVLFRHYRNCIYEELNAILNAGETNGVYKDDPLVMQAQIDQYRKEGFPANYGLSNNSVLIRKHHEPSLIPIMEAWWNEIQLGSKRDQLSLYYILWKTGYKPEVLQHDARNCKWTYNLGAHRKNFAWKYFRFKIKEMFGLNRRGYSTN